MGKAEATEGKRIRDEVFELVRGQKESWTFTINLPHGLHTTFSKLPILMFRIEAENGRQGLEVLMEGHSLFGTYHFNDPSPRTFHEVIDKNHFVVHPMLPFTPNKIEFRLVSGPAGSRLRIADVVLWIQYLHEDGRNSGD